jgi:hypothetical protein
MTCEIDRRPDGVTLIICSRGGGKRQRTTCKCGAPATLACDWRLPPDRKKTCDAPICEKCTTKPAPGKDICPDHKAAYERWRAREVEKVPTCLTRSGG